MATPRKPKEEHLPSGQPTKYSAAHNEQAYKYALLGLKDSQIADLFNVCEATINNWKIEHPKFLESLNEGKDLADSNAAKSLYKRATGLKVKEVTIDERTDQDGNVYQVTSTKTKELPPDTNALRIWLTNRQRSLWKERTEQNVNLEANVKNEHTGKINVESESIESIASLLRDKLNDL